MVQPQPKGQHQRTIPHSDQARASAEARHAILYLEGMLHDDLLKMVDLLEDIENPADFAPLRKALLDITAAVRMNRSSASGFPAVSTLAASRRALASVTRWSVLARLVMNGSGLRPVSGSSIWW